MSTSRMFVLLLLCTLAASPLYSQATFGSLLGTVTDPAGAVVAGAKVTITSEESGVSYSAVTQRIRQLFP